MGSAVKHILTLCITLITLFFVSCGIIEPFGVSSEKHASVSLKLSMNSTQVPELVCVNVSATKGYYTDKQAPYNQPEGLVFRDIPVGEACVNVEAKTGDNIKILDGSAAISLKAGSNKINILLNHVLLSYFIDTLMENTFLVNSDDKSDFWNINYNKSYANLSTQSIPSIEVRSAYGARGYYFLFEINDDEYDIGDINDTNPSGEWNNDACVLYISTNMTAEMAEFADSHQRSFIKIQCMIGADPPETGLINIVEFENGVKKEIIFNDTLHKFNEARVLDIAGNGRIFEIKIDDNFLKILGDPGERIALALRYIDNNPPVLHDWKDIKQDPKVDLDPWGNLELHPQ